jgi:predicted phage baseplate assembly protein
VLSGAVAHEVVNPLPARGGADGEPVAGVLRRGPLVVRHRRQAISAGDYEVLAREASPAVAFARAVAVSDAGARFAPGRVVLTVVPYARDPRPVPTSELRRRVLLFVRARMPAAAADGLALVEPVYLPVGVEAVVAARASASEGDVADAAAAAVRGFLHPLTGGPDGRGWPFGRAVHRSDVAALLDRLPSVDRVERLLLLIDGTPVGDRVDVPADRLVAAAAPRILLAPAGEA